MLHFYGVLILSSLFIYAQSIDIQNTNLNRTIVPSRTIYDLVQIRRAAAKFAALRNRTHRNVTTNNFRDLVIDAIQIDNDPSSKNEREMNHFKNNYNRYLVERLTVMIVIISVALLLMIIIVVTCLIKRYYQVNVPIRLMLSEQKRLTPSRQKQSTLRYTYSHQDDRNFSRKTRNLPAAV